MKTRALPVPQSTNYEKLPRDFQKIGSLGAVANQNWSKIPTYYYDVTQNHFPLTPDEFSTLYADTIDVFNPEGNRTPGHQTNASTAAGVNEPFLAMGVGVVAIGEGKSFSIPGRLVSRPASPTCAPIVDGCPTGNDRDAVLYYGGAIWEFIEKFFQGFRLHVTVNERFLIVKESLFDVGMTPTPAEFIGAGSSLVPAMPYIRKTNDVLHDKSFTKMFLPQNLAGTDCPGAPTSAATYGHPRITGLANRIYCFNRPIPILPGMRFDTQFVRVENDNSFLPDMQRMGVLDVEAGATTPDVDVTDTAICNDSGAFASVYHVPGGTLSLGLVFKGYALQPRACVEYVADYMASGNAMADALSGNVWLASQLLSGIRGANLAGAPDEKDGNAKALIEKIDPAVLQRLMGSR